VRTAAAEQLGDNLGIERCSPGADPANSIDEVGDVEDPILE
jgi:hypothetical protein